MKKSFFEKEYALLLPILLIPIFGSLALGLILCLALVLTIFFLLNKNSNKQPIQFKIIGSIFVAYFFYFSIHGYFFARSLSQHLHDIGKILPILIIGFLLIFIKKETFKISYKAISSMAIASIFLTTFLAIIFKLYPPDINILGETFVQKTGVMARLEMGTGNALPFGTIFITLAFITFVDISNKSVWGKLLSFSAMMLAIGIVVFWNGSRGPLLVVIPQTFLLIWYLTVKSKVDKNWNLFIAGILSVTFLALSSIILHSIEYDMAISTINGLKELALEGSHDESVNIRLTLYKAGVNAFLTKPFLGFGIGNTYIPIVDFLPDTESFHYSHLHNMFLNHAIAGGIFGLLFLFLLIFSPLTILLFRKRKVTTEGKYLALLFILTTCGTGMSNVFFLHDLLAGFFCSLVLLLVLTEVSEVTQNTPFNYEKK